MLAGGGLGLPDRIESRLSRSAPFRFPPDRSISHRESYVKSPSIEVSALVVSAIITLGIGEWLHWIPVIAAIVVVHVLRRK